MRKIQPTRVLVRDGFGHNWTAVSSNPDETGVKRMLSTRSSVLQGPKLSKIQIFYIKIHALPTNSQKLNYPIKKSIFKKKKKQEDNDNKQKGHKEENNKQRQKRKKRI